jgi:hypothetical protein
MHQERPTTQATLERANDGQGDDDMSTTTAHGRLRIAVALAALTVAAPLASAPAHAAGATSAICTNLFAATVTPGFTMIRSAGTITTHGETGLVDCIGTIDGRRITGPGTMGVHYAYSRGTCVAHVGSGAVSLSVPTTAGTKHMTGELTVRRIALVIHAEVRFPNAHFSAIGHPIPTNGSCLITPLRLFLVSVTGRLSGA